MDTQELLSKIERLKSSIEAETDVELKQRYQKMVDKFQGQIAEAEKSLEKKEEKIEKQEEKKMNDVEEKIKRLQAAFDEETDEETKARYKKKIDQFKAQLGEVKEEIKEEKKEIAEQKQEIKEAIKEVKSAEKSVRKTAIKKAKTATKEREKIIQTKEGRKKKMDTMMTTLERLIEKNKQLRTKYKGKKVDLERDSGRPAKPFGYRFKGKYDYRVPTKAQVKAGKKRGTIDYEARPNRADKFPKGMKKNPSVKLADGGEVDYFVGEYDTINGFTSSGGSKSGYPVYARKSGHPTKTLYVYPTKEKANAKVESLKKHNK